MHSHLNLINSGLEREEFIFDAIKSLETLFQLSGTIFNSINQRLESSSNKIRDLKTRLNYCTTLIDSLNDTKSAITLECSPYYPTPDINHSNALLPQKSDHKIILKSEEYKRWLNCVSDIVTYPEDKYINSPLTREIEEIESPPTVNKSKINSTTRTVDSILLFNSCNIPAWEPFNTHPESLKYDLEMKYINHEENLKILLGETPRSFLDFDQDGIFKEDVETLAYNPQSSDIPIIDFPYTLPDLPNIITDIQWNLGSIPLRNLNLPDINSFKAETSTSQNFIPPPPPPPVHMGEPKISESSTTQHIHKVTSEVLVQPPQEQVLQMSNSEPRVNLLEQIKQTAGGGFKLKKVVDKVIDSRRAANKSSVGIAFDAFAELQNRLRLRREGIKGKDKNEKNESDDSIDDIPLPDIPIMRYFDSISKEPKPNRPSSNAFD